MSNILDLSNIETHDLFQELKKRGYKTDLVFGLSDVEFQLEQINSDRDEDDQLKLEEEDKREILERVFYNIDYYCERINEDIEEKILEYES